MSNKYVNEINQSLLLPHVKLGEPVWHLKWETAFLFFYSVCEWDGCKAGADFSVCPRFLYHLLLLNSSAKMHARWKIRFWICHLFWIWHHYWVIGKSGTHLDPVILLCTPPFPEFRTHFFKNTLFKEILNNPPVINFPLNLLLLSLYTTHICYACSACFLMPKCSKTLNC